MKLKQIFKMSIDIIMTALFLVIHHILNWKWYSSLFKGRYTIFRSLMTVVNILLFFAMAGMVVSGILLSREVFGFLNLR